MSRLKRVAPIGVPQHIIQRGNNRQICFGSDEDRVAYIGWLKEYAKKYQVAIHAWVLMTNHVHLLATPYSEGGIGKMLQALGRCYVRYFNYTYQRSGTLWEGRYKASLVDSELYLLELHRYIELNPVRANIVTDPADYSWSSYQCNALGKKSELLTSHDRYLSLAKDKKTRQQNYKFLFDVRENDAVLEDIRRCVQSGIAIGNIGFKKQIEQLRNVHKLS
jgi:putative transposase